MFPVVQPITRISWCQLCRPDGEAESTQYILNLLQLMDENSVAKTFETFELLLEHWARRRVYGALLATVEDMRAAGLRPRPQELHAAATKAAAVRPPCLNILSCLFPAGSPAGSSCYVLKIVLSGAVEVQVGMEKEARAIQNLVDELGYNFNNNRRGTVRRPSRSNYNSERGRAFNG